MPLPENTGAGFEKIRLRAKTGAHCSARTLNGGDLMVTFSRDAMPAPRKLAEPV